MAGFRVLGTFIEFSSGDLIATVGPVFKGEVLVSVLGFDAAKTVGGPGFPFVVVVTDNRGNDYKLDTEVNQMGNQVDDLEGVILVAAAQVSADWPSVTLTHDLPASANDGFGSPYSYPRIATIIALSGCQVGAPYTCGLDSENRYPHAINCGYVSDDGQNMVSYAGTFDHGSRALNPDGSSNYDGGRRRADFGGGFWFLYPGMKTLPANGPAVCVGALMWKGPNSESLDLTAVTANWDYLIEVGGTATGLREKDNYNPASFAVGHFERFPQTFYASRDRTMVVGIKVLNGSEPINQRTLASGVVTGCTQVTSTTDNFGTVTQCFFPEWRGVMWHFPPYVNLGIDHLRHPLNDQLLVAHADDAFCSLSRYTDQENDTVLDVNFIDTLGSADPRLALIGGVLACIYRQNTTIYARFSDDLGVNWSSPKLQIAINTRKATWIWLQRLNRPICIVLVQSSTGFGWFYSIGTFNDAGTLVFTPAVSLGVTGPSNGPNAEIMELPSGVVVALIKRNDNAHIILSLDEARSSGSSPWVTWATFTPGNFPTLCAAFQDRIDGRPIFVVPVWDNGNWKLYTFDVEDNGTIAQNALQNMGFTGDQVDGSIAMDRTGRWEFLHLNDLGGVRFKRADDLSELGVGVWT